MSKVITLSENDHYTAWKVPDLRQNPDSVSAVESPDPLSIDSAAVEKTTQQDAMQLESVYQQGYEDG